VGSCNDVSSKQAKKMKLFLSGLVSFISLLSLVSAEEYAQIEGLKGNYLLQDITSFDGIVLKSIYFDPTPADSSAKNPVVIFISSWGLNKWEYVVPANDLYERGYTVVSYTARGFWGSGGLIDLAGPNDMGDLQTVIDWVIANTNGDPNRIGLSGISYGAGISLLGASMDSRVKSVAAMSGWVDLAESFLGNGETIKTEAVRLLQVAAEALGHPSETLETIFADYFSNTNLDYLYEATAPSSAVNYIDGINKNGAAIFIAQGLGDSLFTPNQFPSYFDQLTIPKHIEFAPGDHAGPELPGLFGISNQIWSRATEWNDFYLLNNQKGVYEDMAQVIFNTMNGDEIESYSSLSEVTTSTLNYELQSKEVLKTMKSSSHLDDVGTVISSFTTGTSANISGGIAYVTSTVEAYIDVQKPFKMDEISRIYGNVFISDLFLTSKKFRGIPKLNLNLVSSASNGTIVVYFVSIDKLNFGHLFTFSPWTFKEMTPNKEFSLSIDMTMTAYDMPKGNKLGIVIATHDRLYLDQSPLDSTISVASGSTLQMPIH
jgi:predicted acyl esterase